MQIAFDQWTQGRKVPTLGTNAGAEKLPFQAWRHFKEAFAPELIARAIEESERPVKRCIDPFGGSGTTALACQFLGVQPTTIEVNPYLADLIDAKLSTYDCAALAEDYGSILRKVRDCKKGHDLSQLPATFVAPGVGNRYIFPVAVAQRIETFCLAINELPQTHHRKLFKALLGGVLIDVSNVIVSGKGRRYRMNWEARQSSASDLDRQYCLRVESALKEVARYANRPSSEYTLLRGDCREMLAAAPRADLAVFSPPYPNSFDYTDVYNVELWMLGYLNSSAGNRTLRESTLTSHVQIRREFAPKPAGSPLLDKASGRLHELAPKLWNRWIPAMVDAYFSDMSAVLKGLSTKLYVRGEVWAVVGDSLYAEVHIPVADILAELAPACGFEVVKMEAFRSMRSSAQQGWRPELNESLIIFRKKN